MTKREIAAAGNAKLTARISKLPEERLRYINFRIDTSAIKDHKVVNGWFVRGQSSTDYNWPMLYEAESLEDAKQYIMTARTSERQTVYGPDGYGIRL